MRSSQRSSLLAGLALTLLPGAGPDLSAHRLDEYLQAARIALEPGRVAIELDLTAGVAAADVVLGEIDRDRTGTISSDEERVYTSVVQQAITLEVDGTPLHLEVADSHFPDPAAVRSGEGTIRIELAANLPLLSPGPHRLLYRNTHRPDIGVYLANVLVPASDRLAVTAQRRDVDQREYIVEFLLRGDGPTGTRGWVVPGAVGLFLVLAALWWRRPR